MFSVARRHLRPGPPDLSTEKGRSAERYRRAAYSLVANVLARGVGMIAMVLGVSWTVPYLGTERFGVWLTIASLAALLNFLDLGVGNAMTNHIAKCAVNHDAAGVRDAVSGGLGFLALIATATSLLLTGVVMILPWDSLVKSSDAQVVDEARSSAICFAALFGANMLSSAIPRVFAGLQRAYEAHVATAIGSVLSILGLWICTAHRAGVPVLLSVTLGSQIASALLLLVVLRARSLISWKNLPRRIGEEARKLTSVSALFFVLQLGAMVGWGADSLIISSVLGVAQVGIYGIAQRLMQFVSVPLSMLNSPLWAAYADAHARGDVGFIRKTLKRSFMLTFMVALAGATCLIAVAQPVITHWTSGSVAVPESVILAFGLWAVLEASGNAFAMFLNGCGIIRPQVSSVLVFCALATPLKFYLATSFGVAGILGATICSYVIAVPLLYATAFRGTISRILHVPPAFGTVQAST